MVKKLFFIFSILLFFVSGVWADETKFEASIPKQVIKGQSFQVTYTVINGSGQDLRVPDFQGCKLLYGPGVTQGSQIVSVNGRTTSQTEESYTYTLRAIQEGTFRIGAATIKINGKQYSTSPVSLQILPPDKQAGNTGNNPDVAATSSSDPEVFARLILSNTHVYEQQAIVASIKLYSRTQISGSGNYQDPTFEGFAVQEIDLKNISVDLENYQGKNYQVAVVRKYLLFPQHAGNLKITSGKYDLIIPVPRKVQGIFGPTVIYSDVTKTVSTQAATINVMPLPAGKPATYMGAVGEFSLTSTINREKLKTNDAVTIKLVLKGKGNVKFTKTPEVKFPEDFEVYDPKIDVQISGLEGTKTIEYTAIARHAGDFTIAPVEFSYFDPESKSYKTTSTPVYHLKVEKGTGGGNAAISDYTDKEALKLLNQDIHFIKLGKQNLKKDQSAFYGGIGYWLWYIVPALLFIIFIIVNRKQARENANIALMKTKKANKVASRRLKQAGKYLKEHNTGMFYEEVLKAVWGYLSDKLSLPLSELTRENVASELNKYGAGDELTDRFMNILDTCEFARYAPSQSDEAMDKLYEETIDAIGKMENTVKKR